MASDKGNDDSTAVEFKHFDIVSDVSDHHYHTSHKSGKDIQSFANVKSSVHRKIMEEWEILARDLPDSIYVRVYDTRIDLLRAVIIGAAGTPYHDGLFFFDIAFPADYPKHPPKVYYHSHGHRLNPNLYSCGTVCLSLINTWSGAKSEKWTPSTSTILQLLVSIQGLVLNDKPFFNEPGLEVGKNKTTGSWQKNSLAYNQEVFTLSCVTMLYNLRKPPKHFESFVADHFLSRGQAVLAAIKAYTNGGCTVGQYKGDGSSSSNPVPVCARFKAKAGIIYKDLEGELRRIAISGPLSKESERAENERLPKSAAMKTEEKTESTAGKSQEILQKPKAPKHGVWKKVISALKWC